MLFSSVTIAALCIFVLFPCASFSSRVCFNTVSKMVISMTDGSKIPGINGLRIQLFHFPHRINASWSYSTPNGMKITKCYMDIQFHNSTVENLTDQTSGPCTEMNCSNAAKWHTVHDLCHKNTTNYFSMSNQGKLDILI